MKRRRKIREVGGKLQKAGVSGEFLVKSEAELKTNSLVVHSHTIIGALTANKLTTNVGIVGILAVWGESAWTQMVTR